MKKINKKGFTLTELIVVIAVIAILAAVLIPTLTGYIEKARVSADNQEVAVLNKLLLDAKINEVEFNNANELKKYLEEEMDYDGDYSLGVKDSYLWYDANEYQFIIKNKNEIDGYASMSDDIEYKRASSLHSPEGLLQYKIGNTIYELWLVGGKGEWVEAVETIRNLGEIVSKDEIKKTMNEALNILGFNQNDSGQLLKELLFIGTKTSFIIDEQGNINDNYSSEDVSGKISTESNQLQSINNVELKVDFHNYVILDNLTIINTELKSGDKAYAELKVSPNMNSDGSFNVDVEIIDQNATASNVLNAVIKTFGILNDGGCLNATITPIIKDNELNEIELTKELYFVEMFNYLDFEDENVINELITVDLQNGNSSILAASTAIAYALYYDAEIDIDNNTWKKDAVALVDRETKLSNVLNKNTIKIEATVEKDGVEFIVVYKFNFIEPKAE